MATLKFIFQTTVHTEFSQVNCQNLRGILSTPKQLQLDFASLFFQPSPTKKLPCEILKDLIPLLQKY